MSEIVIIAESGSDVPAAEAAELGIEIVPMHVSIGQGFVVTQTARHLAENPDISVEELMAWSEELASRVRMGFVPGDLGYLRAGGRLSNAAFVGATLLRIKPIIELLEGKLVATKKLRGNMEKAAIGLMDHMALQGDYDTDVVYLLHSAGLPDAIQRAAEEHARELGFKSIRWYESHNVITSHCGPGSFALAFAGAK